MEDTPWADIQDAVDAMSSAISSCADGECTQEEMWAEIDVQCQALARMAVMTDDEDAEEDEDDAVQGLDFDDERRKEDCSDFEDDEDLN